MDLIEKKCVPCEGGVAPLSANDATKLLKQLDGWTLSKDNQAISKHFSFKNFYKTMAFANAIAFIANEENHHPDMCLGFNYCDINLKTHAISGLSENDFIVAAKIDELLK